MRYLSIASVAAAIAIIAAVICYPCPPWLKCGYDAGVYGSDIGYDNSAIADTPEYVPAEQLVKTRNGR